MFGLTGTAAETGLGRNQMTGVAMMRLHKSQVGTDHQAILAEVTRIIQSATNGEQGSPSIWIQKSVSGQRGRGRVAESPTEGAGKGGCPIKEVGMRSRIDRERSRSRNQVRSHVVFRQMKSGKKARPVHFLAGLPACQANLGRFNGSS